MPTVTEDPPWWSRGREVLCGGCCVGGRRHTGGMFLLAGVSVLWLIVVGLLLAGSVFYGAGMSSTPGAPQFWALG